MADYICIDGGTTNTRVYLVRGLQILDTVRLNLGAGSCGEDPQGFRQALKGAIDTILDRNGRCSGDITRILASGMITSELGLCLLPHQAIPADIGTLHRRTQEASFPEISPIPFVFLRGLKKVSASGEYDIMRGEETEMMGLMHLCGRKECTYILPGSHTKVIRTDSSGAIVDFFTTLTGEMIASLSQYTILRNSVRLDAPLDQQRLLAGYDYCAKEGLNAALFQVRVLDTVAGQSPSALYSFFMGAVLHDEVEKILKENPRQLVLGGKPQIRDAILTILRRETEKIVLCVSDKECEAAVPMGAILIYEHKGEE